MESTIFHILILVLGISLVCSYALHAAVGRSGHMIVGNGAIEMPLESGRLSSIAECYIPSSPAPLPARVSAYKGLLPARAQYRLPEVRLRRIWDQDTAARYEAAKQVRIPAGAVQGSLVEALRRRRLERVQYNQ